MIKYYALNGFATSGKDTFVDMVKNYSGEDVEIVHFSIIDLSRYVVDNFANFKTKDEKYRAVLNEHKLLFDKYGMSRNHVDDEILYAESWSLYDDIIFFIDMRTESDIKWFANKYNAKTIWIENNRVQNIISNEDDKNIFTGKYDIVIKNNGTLEDLKTEVQNFINKEIGEIDE